MRSIQHRRFVQLFCTLLLALYSWAPAQAQLADREGKASSPAVHDHDHDGIDALLREHDQVIEFTENKGQFSEGVLFKADFPMGQALVTANGMLVKAYDPLSVSARASEGMQLEVDHQAGRPIKGITTPLKGHGWLMEFQNASPDVNIEARSQHGEVRNYFIGDKSQHATGARSFQEVWYTNMYRGIDVRYYPAEDGSLEYDIICKPGADPKQIALHFEGIRGTHLGADGTLRLPTSIGELSFPAPVVYQVINGKERSIKSRYVLSKETLGFELEDYDRTQPLVIDPIALRWATWVNTNSANDNHGHCIWVDPSDGAIYVVARVTGSTDQITTGAFNTSNNGDLDMIVGKYLEPTTVGGSGTRVWQTYLGGNGTDNPYAMEQGPDGNLYITGYTSSSNFPLLGGPAFSGSSLDQRSQATDNIYVTKINTAGNSIKSAVVGGNNDDDSFDLRTTPNGDVVVCGKTSSTNWATLYPGSGASNTNNGGTDVLVFKVNQDLSAMQWMRNYGGSGTDYAMIMLRNSTTGDLFIGGYTTSTNFPTVSPRQSTLGGSQAGFLQRLTSTGSTTWSSYYQTASSKSAMILCMEFNNSETEIYFGGTTSGLATSNVSSGSFDTSYNGGTNDLFVGRMAVNQTFVAGTYVGGSNNEVNMMGLNVDQNNDVYIFGYTNSTDFPVSATPNVPLQPSNAGNNDKVFFKLESDLSALEFSTYYGGAADDYDPVGERGIKFSNCRIYTIVTAQSNNLPLTQGALNTTKNSSTSRYEPGLVVWANPPDLLGNSITYTGTAICAGSVPGDITGSVPSYVLPTILRNNSSSAYPSFGSAATYQWQISPDSLTWTDIAGQTSQNLSGSAIGVLTETRYIRRIIGGDACILAGAADQVVTVRIMSVRATVTNVTCHGLSNGSITAIADGLAPFQYAWSNGQSSETATGLAAGHYTVTVTDANGCAADGTFTISEPSTLGGQPTVTPATCANANGGASVAASGGTSPYSYLWSTSQTGTSINGVQGGSYSVTITDAKGCQVTIPVVIPSTGVPTVNAGSNAVITCATGGQINLNGSATAGLNYNWVATNGGHIVSGGSTLNPTVDAAGTYTLTVTDPQSNCSASDAVTVTMNTTAPNASVTGGGTLNCTISSLQLDGGSTTSGATFSWTGPNGFTSTNEDISVNAAGSYMLTVTDPTNGCTSSTSATVILDDQLPGASATGGTLTCSVTSIQLMGSGNGSFAWTGPNGFTSTEQNPTVNAAGTYNLTVTGTNGCTSSTSATVILDDQLPGASATGGTLTCSVTSIQLMGTGNGSFAWTGPNGFTSTEQNPTVNAAGTYNLTVTGTNGCTSSTSVTVILDDQLPSASATGGTLTCSVTSIQLMGTGNGSFAWSGPNGFTSTEQNPTVNAAGTYNLTVTGTNGCTSSTSATVILDDQLPGASATGGTLTCSVTSIQLMGTGNGSFAWSGPNGFTSTEQNPTVNAAGTYNLTVTGTNGCTSSTSATVILDDQLPGASATGGTLTCSVTSIQLMGSGNGSFAWSGPNGFTSTEQNPTVNAAGTYNLTVTGTNGCTSSTSATVILDDQLPGASATGGTLTCSVTSIQLMGTGNGSFAWSGPNGFTSTEQNPTVNAAGTYNLTVTGTNGCTSSTSVTVILDDQLPSASATGGTLTCSVTSIQLMGTGNGSFAWSGPNGFTSTEQNPTVNAAGTYNLTVTGTNGCTSSTSATVILDDQLPGASATGGTLTCSVTSIQLMGSGNGSFAWSGPNGFTSTEQNPTVNAAGTYNLTVTGINGCTSSTSATVILDDQLPGASATGGTLTCSVTSIQLNGSGNGSFAWSGPNGFTSTEQNPTVNAAGTYNLTVTGTNGCTSSTSATVNLDDQLPGASATGGTLTCSVTSIQLMGSGNGSFAWSGPNGFTSTAQNPTVGMAGTYNLTVTGTNGCTSTASAVVEQDDEVPGASAQGGTLNCTISEIMLVGTGNGSFAWSGPNGFTSTAQNPTVGMAGTYNLTVTGANGCTSTASAMVEQDDEVPGASAQGGTLNCTISEIMLVGTGNGSFAWSGPNGFTSTAQNPTVGMAGTYNLTVTGTNGCTSTASAVVEQDDEVPGASAQGGTLNCTISEIMLVGTGNGSFAWTGPNGFTSSAQNPTVGMAGTYNLTVTGTNGCTSTASAMVEQDDEVPGASAQGGTLNCTISEIMLVGTGNGSFAWSGPNGFTSTAQNPTVGMAGTYNLIVTGANGCTSTASAVVEQDDEVPGASAQGGTLNCTISEIMLVGTGNGSFAWTGPNGFTSTAQNPTVGMAGTYNLTVTGANGCTSTASAVIEQDDEVPGASAQGGTLNCTISEIMLVGTGNGSFAWTGPNGFTSTEQNPTVNAAGTYNLTVTGTNGCTSTASAVIEQDDEVPGASAQGGTLNCMISEIMLVGTGNGSFAWSGPNGFTSTAQNPTVGMAGTYNLIVTGANGCTSTASAVVEQDDEVPGASAQGGTLNCTISEIMLVGTGNGSFAWSGPNGFTSTAQNPTVGMAGTYNLTVTGANGCTSTASAMVEQDDEVPGASAQGGTLNCTISEIMLVGTGNGSFAWSGPNGFTSTAQNPTVGMAGTYNLTVTGANGCTSTASAVVDADITVPYVSASGGAITCTNQTVILNANGNGDFLWTGPNGFTSTSQFPMVSVAGTYTVTITAANGCTNSATTTVSNEANAPEFVADGGDLPCEGGFVVMTLFTDASNPTFSWSGPDGFTSTEQEPVVTAPGIYNVVVTTANGCSSTANVWVYRNDCGDKCPPMISECPADITVECSADYSPEALGGMPTFREDDGSGYYDDKGKKCPEIINTGWTDAYISYCPFVIQRTFYAVDEVGTTETCVQLITIHDEVGPVFENTPADRTISCDFDMDNFQLPAVWAFDECTKSVTETFHSQVVIPGDCANEYVRVHTWTSTDYCSNTSTFVWNVNVVDDEAPAFQCHPQDMTVYEVDIPEPPTCNVIDNCDPEVMIAYTETVEAVDDKEYIIVRHWTATDACGNWSEQDQSITVISKKGDGGQIDPKMLVTVAPNPFRDQCFITFEAKEEGKAVVLITDPQGRVVSEAFNGVVSKGQPTRVAFTPVENGSGFYLYRIQMNGKEVHGRMIYQP